MITFHFADALIARMRELGHPCIVGLDPDLRRMPPSFTGRAHDIESSAQAITEYCVCVVDAVHDLVAAVKPQSAYFEVYGSAGARALEQVVAAARARGLLVILDAKRGDIGSTSEAYAEAYLSRSASPMSIDALTLSPYLGRDSLEPFVAKARANGSGLFVCVKTSNPGSRDLQDLVTAGGERVYDRVAASVAEWNATTMGRHGYGNVGAVVGATFPDAAAALRRSMPHVLFLIPGFGAQGGTVAAIQSLLAGDGGGVIVSSSRAIMYPHGIEAAADPGIAVREAAESFVASVKVAISPGAAASTSNESTER